MQSKDSHVGGRLRATDSDAMKSVGPEGPPTG